MVTWGCAHAYLGGWWGTVVSIHGSLMPCFPCLQAAHVPLPARGRPAMAIVQTLPVPLEAVAEGATQLRTTTCSPPATMGSVGSLLPVRPRHDCASDGDPSTASFCKQEGLLGATPEETRVSVPGVTHSYANGGFCGDWLDASSPASPCSDSDDLRDDQAPSDHLRGPPPKLVPVSGKLEEVRGQQQGGWVCAAVLILHPVPHCDCWLRCVKWCHMATLLVPLGKWQSLCS